MQPTLGWVPFQNSGELGEQETLRAGGSDGGTLREQAVRKRSSEIQFLCSVLSIFSCIAFRICVLNSFHVQERAGGLHAEQQTADQNVTKKEPSASTGHPDSISTERKHRSWDTAKERIAAQLPSTQMDGASDGASNRDRALQRTVGS
jgi:hypothetical protein